ncbi:hypothetical protein D3C79_780860 [compost metagenome]
MPEQAAKHRQTQGQAHQPQTQRRLVSITPNPRATSAAKSYQQPPEVRLQPLRQADHLLGKGRQLGTKAAEQRLKARHHLQQQQCRHPEAHQQHQQWISHGLFKPRAQGLALLLQRRDLGQHHLQAAGLLTGVHQVAVQPIEIVRVPAQRRGQAAAGGDIALDCAQQAGHRRVGAALGDHIQRLQQRHPGLDQGGQLAAELAQRLAIQWPAPLPQRRAHTVDAPRANPALA